MVRALYTAAAAASLLAAAEAVAYVHDPAAKTLAMSFQRRDMAAEGPRGSRLAKRQGKSVGESISWGGLLYYINITLGTPGQSSAVWLDTGSSDLWLPDTGSNLCQTNQLGCSSNGGFNPAKSSSYKVIKEGAFSISYASGDQITGDFGEDTLSMDQATINDMIFGVAKDGQTSTQLSGIMGIGYTLGEAIAQTSGQTYPNIIDKLVEAGIISTKTYSLYLDDLDIGHGTILFGGVDTDKYDGTLGIVNVQETEQTQAFDTFTVVLSSLTFEAGGQTNNIDLGDGLPVILDSGTTLTYLPDDLAMAVYEGLGITYDDVDGAYVPCNVATAGMHFTFTFGSDKGVAIDVDLGQFVLPYDKQAGLPSINGGEACQFGLLPAGTVAQGGGDILFGDTFLRSAYLVYDLDNNQIAMAQTKFGASGSNVKGIASGAASTNTIPGATTVANQQSAGQSANPTNIGAAPTGAGSGSGTNSSPISSPATFSGLPNGGLTTGATVAGSGASSTSKSAASVRVPPFDWAAVATGGFALVAALMGGSWFALL